MLLRELAKKSVFRFLEAYFESICELRVFLPETDYHETDNNETRNNSANEIPVEIPFELSAYLESNFRNNYTEREIFIEFTVKSWN